MNNWTHKGEEVTCIPEGYEHFVYLITNVSTGKRYWGKKQSYSMVTRPPLAGQKRKRKLIKESDWRTYHGSSDSLKADVAELGADNFKREILHWCRSKAEASYLELYEQMVNHAILDPMSYNSWVSARCNANHLNKMSEEMFGTSK